MVNRVFYGLQPLLRVSKATLLIRNLTRPQTVNTTFLYRCRSSRNLSLATRNILTKRIKCSTAMRDEDNSLFSCFWHSVILLFLGFL